MSEALALTPQEEDLVRIQPEVVDEMLVTVIEMHIDPDTLELDLAGMTAHADAALQSAIQQVVCFAFSRGFTPDRVDLIRQVLAGRLQAARRAFFEASSRDPRFSELIPDGTTLH
jgi:hypothetical protein